MMTNGTEQGGSAGRAKEASGVVGQIKAGFHPDPDKTGFRAILSRVKNLWKSGVPGKIVIVVAGSLVLAVVTPSDDSATSEGKQQVNGPSVEQSGGVGSISLDEATAKVRAGKYPKHKMSRFFEIRPDGVRILRKFTLGDSIDEAFKEAKSIISKEKVLELSSDDTSFRVTFDNNTVLAKNMFFTTELKGLAVVLA